MHWDRMFEDLEAQLAAEWESERAALATETERLRIAQIDLLTRCKVAHSLRATVLIDLGGSAAYRAQLSGVGKDWIAWQIPEQRSLAMSPIASIASLGTDLGALLGTLSDESREPSLQEQMTFGFVLRDLARKRVPVSLTLTAGTTVDGTVDRVGVDHLDIAEHDAGASRRPAAVRCYRMVAFTAIRCVRLSAAGNRVLAAHD